MWMHRRRSAPDHVNRYWNALARGAAAEELARLAEPLDSRLVAAIDQAHAAHHPRRPDPAFANRLEHDLMHAFAASHARPIAGLPGRPANGRAPASGVWVPAEQARSGRRVPAFAHLATALLVVVTLFGAYLAFGGRGNDRPAVAPNIASPIPAATTAGETEPAAPDATLFSATFTEDELPQGGAEPVFYQLTLEPGASLSYPAGPYCGCGGQEIAPGVGVEVVASGTYAVRLTAPVRVVRAGSDTPEEIAAETEVTLGAGDVVIFPDYAAPGELRNAGVEPLVVLGVAITAHDVPKAEATPAPRPPEGVRATQLTSAFVHVWEMLQPGGVTIELRRVTLDPGEQLPPVDAVALETVRVEAGEIALGIIPAGTSEPQFAPNRYREGRTTAFLFVDPNGVTRQVENSGEGPATVLILTIRPAGPGSATPAP